jgi:hypothetical protein
VILFHFTSRFHLRGIAKHGLTVGDVPTDISRGTGRVGVWLTNFEAPDGHGVRASQADKTRFRLSVDIDDDDRKLVYWPSWAAQNVTPDTIAALHAADGCRFQTWFVYFGAVPSSRIKCFDRERGVEIGLDGLPETSMDRPGVPYWRRDAWHKKLVKAVGRMARHDPSILSARSHPAGASAEHQQERRQRVHGA